MTIRKEIVSLCVLLLLALTCGTIYPKQSNQYINSINWFDGNERLIWINNNGKIKVPSNISVDSCDQLYDVMYLDSINDKIYAIDSISHCAATICKDVFSFCVDSNSNTIYFVSLYGLFYFNSTLEIEQLSLNYNYSSYNVHTLAIYEDYLYVSAFSIGIIRLQFCAIHNYDTKVNNADVLINDKLDIMSFGTDIKEDIMYFCTENKIYNFNIFDKIYSLFDVKINSLMIYTLQLNYDGTMLFIQYKQDDYVYVMNWPTYVGCVSCKPKAKLLYSTTLAVTKRMQSFYHVHSKHASSRKLLLNFDTSKTFNITLPQSDAAVTVGYYNNTILALGGKDYSSQVVEFNVVDNKITDNINGLNVLPTRTYGYGQFYTEINELIFTIDSTGSVLSTYTYTMNTKTFEYNWNVVHTPKNVLDGTCLTSTENYLFIFGGSNGDWYSNYFDFQAIKYDRQHLSCNVHPISKELYAIGGYQDNYKHDYFVTKIEKIYINGNISTETWKELNDNLLPTRQLQSVMFGNDISVIGDDQKNTVQTINCITGKVMASATLLEYPASLTASIIVTHMIYTFAVSVSNGNVNTWQYIRLTTTTYTPTQPTYVSNIYSNSSLSTNIGMDNYRMSLIIQDYDVSNQHSSIIHQEKNLQTMTCTNINQVVSPTNINPLTVLAVMFDDDILSYDNMNINTNNAISLPLESFTIYSVITAQNKIKHNYDYKIIYQSPNAYQQMILKQLNINITLIMCDLIDFYNTKIKLLTDYFSYTYINYFNASVNKTITKNENINVNFNTYDTSFKIAVTILLLCGFIDQYKEDMKKLKNKIQNLESVVSKYKNIMTENNKTVSVLKNRIHKIQTERDETTRQIEVLNKNNIKDKEKQVEKLKNKNIELKSLASALVINLARKEQSLEEALDVIHSLSEVNEQMTYGNNIEHSTSRSLTDMDILEMHSHSNINLEYDESDDDDMDVYENSCDKRQSFTKHIARRLRKSLTRLTETKKSQ